MFLAKTGIKEFWDQSDQLLFLGLWCGPDSAERVLESPWRDEALLRRSIDESRNVYERLLAVLGAYLNEVHGPQDLRYWRLLIGPWLLSHVTSLRDRFVHLQAAFARFPELRTIVLDTSDFVTPEDTWDACARVRRDAFNLQLYTQVLRHWGRDFPTRRFRQPPAFRQLEPSALKSSVFGALSGLSGSFLSSTTFSDLYLSRADLWRLIADSGGRWRPAFCRMPRGFHFAADGGERRSALGRLQAGDDFERLLVATLPVQFPTLFLEGYGRWRGLVRARWPRLPARIVTAIGHHYNEFFKMLAAEATAAGGKLVVVQHGGAYGVFETIDRELHERAIADEYWTWGWTDQRRGRARLKPVAHPCLSRGKPAAAGSEWVLVSTSMPRFPYSWYWDNVPVWHRFNEYIEGRERFIGALSPATFRRLKVRLHPDDGDWHQRAGLLRRFSQLGFDSAPTWRQRLGACQLAVMDHPQTTFLESLAADKPTVLFWDPSLWLMRAEAAPYFEGLRQAGILHDSPESAAAAVEEALAGPAHWWADAKRQNARRAFCERYALGAADWTKRWVSAAG